MPIYEYRCLQCGEHFEIRQTISDKPLTDCENCGGKLEKQWSLSGFQFKGEGWYVTDYAAKKDAKGEKASKPDSSEKSAGSESTAKAVDASKPKSDAKTASKTDTSSKKE